MELIKLNSSSLPQEEKIKEVEQLLYNLGATFVQHLNSSIMPTTKMYNGFLGCTPNTLFLSDNMEDILGLENEKAIERYLDCSIKYTSNPIV